MTTSPESGIMRERAFIDSDLSEAEFRRLMCLHMTKQTDFLEGIYKAVEVLVTIGKFIKWVAGFALGALAIWELLKAVFKS